MIAAHSHNIFAIWRPWEKDSEGNKQVVADTLCVQAVKARFGPSGLQHQLHIDYGICKVYDNPPEFVDLSSQTKLEEEGMPQAEWDFDVQINPNEVDGVHGEAKS